MNHSGLGVLILLVLFGVALFAYLQYGREGEAEAEPEEQPEPIYYFDELEMNWPPNSD